MKKSRQVSSKTSLSHGLNGLTRVMTKEQMHFEIIENLVDVHSSSILGTCFFHPLKAEAPIGGLVLDPSFRLVALGLGVLSLISDSSTLHPKAKNDAK